MFLYPQVRFKKPPKKLFLNLNTWSGGFEGGIKIKGMVMDIDFEYFLNSLLDVLDSRVAELKYLPGVRKDNMIMLFVKIWFLISCFGVPEQVLSNQTTGYHQFDIVVDCGPAHPVVLFLHLEVKLIHIKMFVVGINLL